MSEHVPAHRFRAAIAALVGIAIGAIAVALVVIIGGDNRRTTSAKWSSWSPPDSGTLGAREIADHLAPLYRISSVDQLDVVTVVNLSASDRRCDRHDRQRYLDKRPPGRRAPIRHRVRCRCSAATRSPTTYAGSESNCSITAGKASPDRLLLLRREALELALYTFKYIDGVQNVVAILPPGHTVAGCSGSARPRIRRHR